MTELIYSMYLNARHLLIYIYIYILQNISFVILYLFVILIFYNYSWKNKNKMSKPLMTIRGEETLFIYIKIK